jgi:hypothetical protein
MRKGNRVMRIREYKKREGERGGKNTCAQRERGRKRERERERERERGMERIQRVKEIRE